MATYADTIWIYSVCKFQYSINLHTYLSDITIIFFFAKARIPDFRSIQFSFVHMWKPFPGKEARDEKREDREACNIFGHNTIYFDYMTTHTYLGWQRDFFAKKNKAGYKKLAKVLDVKWTFPAIECDMESTRKKGPHLTTIKQYFEQAAKVIPIWSVENLLNCIPSELIFFFGDVCRVQTANRAAKANIYHSLAVGMGTYLLLK